MFADLKYTVLFYGLPWSFAVAGAQTMRLELNWVPVTEQAMGVSDLPNSTDGLYRMDLAALYQQLEDNEWNANDLMELDLPMPGGGLARFSLRESPVLLPPLASKYPAIRTFSGWRQADPATWVKLDITPQGLHALIHAVGAGYVFIDPFERNGMTLYRLRYPTATGDIFGCANPVSTVEYAPAPVMETPVLRHYRLALAATAEYTAFHQGKANALAAQVTTINRINGIYEHEMAVHLQIIGNNDTLIHTDPATDPYTNSNATQMESQNQKYLDSIIGTDNYDVGHVFFCFPTGGSVADVGSVCNPQSKARAVSGSGSPAGDFFELNKVAHELGHQFGASHSFNNSCDGNIDLGAAFEPGSGSTIMGYAGLCPPDIQPHNDPYFHGASLLEIKAFLNGPSNNCALLSPLQNTAPQVNVPSTHYTIPAATPFVLTASATDPDAVDQLTYNWEQIDAEMAPMPPQAQAGAGPAFRSFPPANAPQRYFPNLPDLLSGSVPVWEVLATVTRDLHFMVTVRDNAPGGGSTATDSVTVRVDATAGPFKITAPNGAETWTGTNAAQISWEVAGTNAGMIHCTAVDLLLSSDGGLHFSDTLAAQIPNSGLANINIPDLDTDSAVLMIKCADNIFFDLSDQHFSIRKIVSVDALAGSPTKVRLYLNPARHRLNIILTGVHTQPVQLWLVNPAGQTALHRQFREVTGGVIELDIHSFPAGIYVAIIQTPAFTICKRVILFP